MRALDSVGRRCPSSNGVERRNRSDCGLHGYVRSGCAHFHRSRRRGWLLRRRDSPIAKQREPDTRPNRNLVSGIVVRFQFHLGRLFHDGVYRPLRMARRCRDSVADSRSAQASVATVGVLSARCGRRVDGFNDVHRTSHILTLHWAVIVPQYVSLAILCGFDT